MNASSGWPVVTQSRHASFAGVPQSTRSEHAGVGGERQLRHLETRFYERKEAAVADLQKFFGRAVDKLVTLTLEVNVMDLLMIQRSLKALLEGWTIVRECRYDEDVSVLVKRLAVEVAPDQFDFVIRCGRQFWEGPNGRRLTADIWASDDRKVAESEVTLTVAEADYPWLAALLPELKKWADQNHFVRGKAITASAKFIRFADQPQWEDVIIPPALREALERNCTGLLAHAALFRANGVPLRRGIVLHGPPGTGKTLIGRVLAQRSGVTFILVTPGMLDQPPDVTRVFEWGRRFAPSILFFEDFDLVAGSRHGGSRRDILGEFLSCLDGVHSHEGLITIATTNDLRAIEPALKERPNRFDAILEVPALGSNERMLFLQRWIRRNGVIGGCSQDEVEHAVDLSRIAERTGGFTGAQLQELCRLAVFEAVHERIAENATEAIRLPLHDAHFDRALKRSGVRRKRPVGFTASE